MRICPKCGNALGDDARFCTLCGTKFVAPEKSEGIKLEIPGKEPAAETPVNEVPEAEAPSMEIPQPEAASQNQQAYQQGAAQQQYQQTYQQPVYTQPAYDPFDHTAEFEADDISANKVVAMLPYLMGIAGIVVAALIGATNSPYTMFHIRQALKFTVVDILVGIASAILSFTIIVPIAGGICFVVLFVIKIICFFNVCNGKAKEPAIIRSLGFLK